MLIEQLVLEEEEIELSGTAGDVESRERLLPL